MQPLGYRAADPRKRDFAFPFVLGGLATGVSGNVIGMLAASTLRHVPPGSSIRPMTLAAVLSLIAFATATIGIPLVIIGLVHARRRAVVWLIGMVGALVSLAPLPASRWVWDQIEARNRFIMEP
jgi:hypothetical protein